ncbi:YmdB family metallophosphoesterase [Candidatus Peregrinibacteria bacterium]|nr:YmdB family metallophosphoesterase [Candidatus Peregrinibacteria bacterium]
MNILVIGDVFAKVGREMIKKHLANLTKERNIDLVIANVDNVSHGKGPRKKEIEELRSYGVEVFTCGNHSFDQKEFSDTLEKDDVVLRPENYPYGAPGKGHTIIKNVLILHLMGRVFMPEGMNSPFYIADKILEQYQDKKFDAIMVDFHAEATSEKNALKHYLEGRVSAVLGTHTHVQTADEQVSSKGTSYITDIGMTGPSNSIIGAKKEIILNRFLTALPQKFEPANGDGQFCAVLLTISKMQTTAIERIFIKDE